MFVFPFFEMTYFSELENGLNTDTTPELGDSAVETNPFADSGIRVVSRHEFLPSMLSNLL